MLQDSAMEDYLRRLALKVGPAYPIIPPYSPWASNLWPKADLERAARNIELSVDMVKQHYHQPYSAVPWRPTHPHRSKATP